MAALRSLPAWTKKFLQCCAAYYLACGISALFFPASWFWAAGIASLAPEQSNLLLAAISAPMFGLMTAAWLAASAPGRHPEILAALVVANSADALVNVHAGAVGRLPIFNSTLFVLIALVWATGAAILLWLVYRAHLRADQENGVDLATALALRPAGRTESLAELSDIAPLLFVFIRHAGCTFCREHLDRLKGETAKQQSNPAQIVIVGMSSPDELRALVDGFGLTTALVVSDMDRVLYRALEIRRGSLWQLLGPRELWHALGEGALLRYGVGPVQGDAFQLPGTALVHRRRVLATRAAESASEYCSIEPMVQQVRT